MSTKVPLAATAMAAAILALAGWAGAHDASAPLSEHYFSRPDAEKDGQDAKKDAKKGGKADASKAAPGGAAAGAGGDEKPFDTVVKDYEEITGVLRFYRKADDNKTLLEIPIDQLDKTLFFAWSVDQSVGERGLYASRSAPTSRSTSTGSARTSSGSRRTPRSPRPKGARKRARPRSRSRTRSWHRRRSSPSRMPSGRAC